MTTINPLLQPGDHLITRRIGFTHHGLYLGDGQVLQYLLRLGVVIVPLETFTKEHELFIREHPNARYSREQAIKRGMMRLGEDHYNLFTRNCEHFVNWCIEGEEVSRQVDNLILTIIPFYSLFQQSNFVRGCLKIIFDDPLTLDRALANINRNHPRSHDPVSRAQELSEDVFGTTREGVVNFAVLITTAAQLSQEYSNWFNQTKDQHSDPANNINNTAQRQPADNIPPSTVSTATAPAPASASADAANKTADTGSARTESTTSDRNQKERKEDSPQEQLQIELEHLHEKIALYADMMEKLNIHFNTSSNDFADQDTGSDQNGNQLEQLKDKVKHAVTTFYSKLKQRFTHTYQEPSPSLAQESQPLQQQTPADTNPNGNTSPLSSAPEQNTAQDTDSLKAHTSTVKLTTAASYLSDTKAATDNDRGSANGASPSLHHDQDTDSVPAICPVPWADKKGDTTVSPESSSLVNAERKLIPYIRIKMDTNHQVAAEADTSQFDIGLPPETTPEQTAQISEEIHQAALFLLKYCSQEPEIKAVPLSPKTSDLNFKAGSENTPEPAPAVSASNNNNDQH